MGLVAELDTSGRFTPLIAGTQTLGSCVGPVVAGLLVFNGSYLYVYLLASILWGPRSSSMATVSDIDYA